jgi:hypothetical protein
MPLYDPADVLPRHDLWDWCAAHLGQGGISNPEPIPVAAPGREWTWFGAHLAWASSPLNDDVNWFWGFTSAQWSRLLFARQEAIAMEAQGELDRNAGIAYQLYLLESQRRTREIEDANGTTERRQAAAEADRAKRDRERVAEKARGRRFMRAPRGGAVT